MNSKERHENRYRRRVAARQAKRDEYSRSFGSFEDVFSYEHLYDAGKKCSKGVLWKSSTQSYLSRLVSNTATIHDLLMNGKFKSKGFHDFDIIERGKLRHIRSVHISERVVQKCLCDNILVPVFSHSFIFDNAASLKGKGVDFAMDRLSEHLRKFYRKFGDSGIESGGVLIGDFSDFFNSAPHEIIYKEVGRRIHDERVRDIVCQLMEDFGDAGFGLGSQVSQIDALMVASPLDHFIKERLHIKYYGRYMDDFYLIHEDRNYLKFCMNEIRRKCAEYGLSPNDKKTRIAPLRKGVKFLKTRFFISKSGAVVRKINRDSSVRMRKKLRIFHQWLDNGKFSIADVNVAYQSWRGHMMRGNTHFALRCMDMFFFELFGKEGL